METLSIRIYKSCARWPELHQLRFAYVEAADAMASTRIAPDEEKVENNERQIGFIGNIVILVVRPRDIGHSEHHMDPIQLWINSHRAHAKRLAAENAKKVRSRWGTAERGREKKSGAKRVGPQHVRHRISF